MRIVSKFTTGEDKSIVGDQTSICGHVASVGSG